MRKSLALAVLPLMLVGTMAVSCEQKPTEYAPYDLSDCDADDRVGKWDVEDCGPSPAASKKPTTSRNTPAPKKTRR